VIITFEMKYLFEKNQDIRGLVLNHHSKLKIHNK